MKGMSKEDFNKEADDLKHVHISGALDRIERTVEKTAKAIEYTNGKVKKLIIAMVAMSAFLAGSGIVDGYKLLNLVI